MNISQLRLLSEKILSMKDSITTEEATKTSFILPFIQNLGYDVFNPNELIAESTSDVGSKKGEKVDYLVSKDSEPIYIIECKKCCENLAGHRNQLIRYFHTAKARIGILTNGIEYEFYSDLDKPNIMDEAPFFTFNVLKFSEYDLKVLKYFTKSEYNLDSILAQAASLKYMFKVKNAIAQELHSPTKDFIRLFIKKVYPDRITKKVYEEFEGIIKGALQEYVLPKTTSKKELADEEIEEDDGIETTVEELEVFNVVKNLFPEHADSITYIDYKGHFSVVLNNNRRLIICKAQFNRRKKYLVFIDSENEETRVPFTEDFSVIDNHKDLMKSRILSMLE